MAPNPEAKKHRVEWLDAWRGVAVLVMIGWHCCWDLGMLGVIPISRMEEPFAVGVRYFIVCSFVLLSGISCRYSRSNLRRGLQTLVCAPPGSPPGLGYCTFWAAACCFTPGWGPGWKSCRSSRR